MLVCDTGNITLLYYPSLSRVGKGGQQIVAELVANVCCALCFPVGPPDITARPQSVAVESGSNVEFNCNATGLGTLTFMWTTNAPVGTLPSSVENINTATMTATSTLSLSNVDTSYRGDYVCTVSNERGRDTAQATLSVIG